jgi:lysophospholipase L1-like esterase
VKAQLVEAAMSLFIHDSLLGHVPNPGCRTSGFANSFHTIDSDGLRHCGETLVSNEGPILAVGDSFTYGDEVLDEEAWPAQLQRLTDRRVLNGGVTGYGFDQIVLRAEQLIEMHKPSVVIVGFIAHDILRTEFRRLWWRDKPWFAIEGDELVLKGVPVPHGTRLPIKIRHQMDGVVADSPPILQHLLGYHVRVHRAGEGLKVAQRLIKRLVRLRAKHPVKMILMAQYPPAIWIHKAEFHDQRRVTGAVINSAAAHGLATLDTFQRLATEPEPHNFYGVAHMNARGNVMIASLLAATLPTLLESPRSGTS